MLLSQKGAHHRECDRRKDRPCPDRQSGAMPGCRQFWERGKPHCSPAHFGAPAGKPQGDLLSEGVWDGGESEGSAVAVEIGACALLRKQAHFRLVQPSRVGC